MKLLAVIIFIFSFLFFSGTVFAHGVVESDNHTDIEEIEGKEILAKLQAKEINCDNLSDDDFGALGEYFMGQMLGEAHEAMNNMMTQMMGEAGEEQAHIVMGKKLSGCDTNAVWPSQGFGFMPMMNMGMGNWDAPRGNMGFGTWNTWNWFNGITTFLLWAVLVLALVALVKWIFKDKK